MTLVWNLVGIADLVTAVTLGVGSADSPIRFIVESPNSGAIATLPWMLIPAAFVPMYLVSHLAVFAQLRAASTNGREREMSAMATGSEEILAARR
jgi:hypothetical protein